ncbi:hypothetical protein ACVW1A_000045 [Bradyrhizobium sp. LB1.3]
MAMKTLINRTVHHLRVTLIVRKGDHPENNAGTVDVSLGVRPPSSDVTTIADDAGVKDVAYGNEVDIYLNGLTATMIADGSGVGRRDVVVDRGSPLDNELNTNDTIVFSFDGEAVLVSATNSDQTPHAFPAD